MTPQLFEFQGRKVRTVIIDKTPYFVGKDVAEVLGYQNPSRDINRHVEKDDRQNYQNGSLGSNRGVTVINESGLYSLILGSKQPNAKEFKRWVTSDVLPTIRKTGQYSIQQKPDSYMIEDPVKRAKRWIEERKAYEKLLPKGEYYDSQMRNPGLMTTTEIAKDFGMSATALNKKLHQYKVVFKQGRTWVLYQKYANCGYTQYEPFPTNGNSGVKNLLKWTQRGRKFIYDLLAEHDIHPVLEEMNLLN